MIPASPRPELDRLRNDDPAERVVATLRDAILGGQLRQGDRLATLRQIAGQYQISFKSARSAMTRLQEMKLVELRQGSGTYVTHRPRPTSALTQGVALLVDFREHLFDELTADLVNHVQAQGLLPVRYSRQSVTEVQDVLPLLEAWHDTPPRAIVLQWASEDGSLDRLLGKLAGKSRIVTAFRLPAPQWHSVNPDVPAAMRMAVRHLLDAGHRRIGLVTHARIIRPNMPYTLRKRTIGHTPTILAAGQVLRDAGLRGALSVHYNVATDGPGSVPLHEVNLRRAAQWLSGRNRPTAIVGEDFRLVGIIRAAERLGLSVPNDLTVLGLGNTPWAEAFGFPSVSYQIDLVARHVAELLRQPADTRDAVHHVNVQPRLVLR